MTLSALHQKRLAVGFETVLVISPEKKNLAKIQRAVDANLEKDQTGRMRFFTVEDFLNFLDEEEARAAITEQTVRGYKVKAKYRILNGI